MLKIVISILLIVVVYCLFQIRRLKKERFDIEIAKQEHLYKQNGSDPTNDCARYNVELSRGWSVILDGCGTKDPPVISLDDAEKYDINFDTVHKIIYVYTRKEVNENV